MSSMMSNALVVSRELDKARSDLDDATKSLGIVWDTVDDRTGRQLALAIEATVRAVASVTAAVERLAELPMCEGVN